MMKMVSLNTNVSPQLCPLGILGPWEFELDTPALGLINKTLGQINKRKMMLVNIVFDDEDVSVVLTGDESHPKHPQ